MRGLASSSKCLLAGAVVQINHGRAAKGPRDQKTLEDAKLSSTLSPERTSLMWTTVE
ncbi:hypothetical protein [Rhizobium phaseoli]|uniref:hypothetical protein n=1 Tax=Rhizobium phaseoli TaxID=396 RepID=UPI000A499552|nr:hypothetical protein [Rhizobium phaseoli]